MASGSSPTSNQYASAGCSATSGLTSNNTRRKQMLKAYPPGLPARSAHARTGPTTQTRARLSLRMDFFRYSPVGAPHYGRASGGARSAGLLRNPNNFICDDTPLPLPYVKHFCLQILPDIPLYSLQHGTRNSQKLRVSCSIFDADIEVCIQDCFFTA